MRLPATDPTFLTEPRHMVPPTDPIIRVLFVCLGNICRSPLAEGVFRHVVEQAGLSARFVIESAGTSGWHVGDLPDRRMRETAAAHGVMLDSRGRQFETHDFERFDHILVMDRDNLHDVLYLDPHGTWRDRVRLFREYDPEPGDYQVPDPYYGGIEGFERVYAMVERTSRSLLDAFVAHYGVNRPR